MNQARLCCITARWERGLVMPHRVGNPFAVGSDADAADGVDLEQVIDGWHARFVRGRRHRSDDDLNEDNKNRAAKERHGNLHKRDAAATR